MKKLIGSLAAIVIATTLFFNTTNSGNKDVGDLNLASLIAINIANAEQNVSLCRNTGSWLDICSVGVLKVIGCTYSFNGGCTI